MDVAGGRWTAARWGYSSSTPATKFAEGCLPTVLNNAVHGPLPAGVGDQPNR